MASHEQRLSAAETNVTNHTSWLNDLQTKVDKLKDGLHDVRVFNSFLIGVGTALNAGIGLWVVSSVRRIVE